jgi:hypothetical protein
LLVGHLVDSTDHDFYGEMCQDCSNVMHVGDVAMVFDRGRGVFTDRDLVWHRRCIRAALDSAPLEQDELAEAIDAIRRRGLAPIREALGA